MPNMLKIIHNGTDENIMPDPNIRGKGLNLAFATSEIQLIKLTI
jgi:hypothetical protein